MTPTTSRSIRYSKKPRRIDQQRATSCVTVHLKNAAAYWSDRSDLFKIIRKGDWGDIERRCVIRSAGLCHGSEPSRRPSFVPERTLSALANPGGRPGRRPSPPPLAFRKASCRVRLRENAPRDNRASRGRSLAHRRIAAPCDPMTGHARYRSDIEEKSLPRLRGERATPTPLPSGLRSSPR